MSSDDIETWWIYSINHDPCLRIARFVRTPDGWRVCRDAKKSRYRDWGDLEKRGWSKVSQIEVPTMVDVLRAKRAQLRAIKKETERHEAARAGE
jgi:hypothetical protein